MCPQLIPLCKVRGVDKAAPMVLATLSTALVVNRGSSVISHPSSASQSGHECWMARALLAMLTDVPQSAPGISGTTALLVDW